MANFDRSGMTQAGINLMGKAIGGATIQFTKLVLGDGEMTGEILDLQGVVSPKQNVDVTRIERNDNQCTVGGELLTSSVKQGFFWRECGLYAMDPDLGEILYNYAYSTKPDYIAASDSGMMEEILVSMVATVGSNANVDVNIDTSMVYTTRKEFDPLKVKVEDVTLNVKDFGVIGDGVTDDSQALQSAIDKAVELKCKLLIPRGEYLCNSGLIINGYMKLECQGKLIYKGSDTFLQVKTTWARHCVLNGLHIIGTNRQGIGVRLDRSGWGACANVTNFRIENFNIGIFFVMAFNNLFDCGNVVNCNICFKSDVSLDGTYPLNRDVFGNVNTFENVLFDQGVIGADMTGLITTKFLSCTFQSLKTGASYYNEERQRPDGVITNTKAYCIIFDTCWFEAITEQVFSNYKFVDGVRTNIKSSSPFTPIVTNCNFPVNPGNIYDQTDGYGFDINPTTGVITSLPDGTIRPLDYLHKQKKFVRDRMWVYDPKNSANAYIYEIGNKGSTFRTRFNSFRVIDFKGATSVDKNNATVTFETTNIGGGTGIGLNDKIGTLCFITVTIMCYNGGLGKQTFLLSNSHYSDKSVSIMPITELESQLFAGVDPIEITIDRDPSSYVQKATVSASANGIIKLQVDVSFIPLGSSVQSNQNTLYGEL